MTDTKYNGWTNWETWNFNLWFDEYFCTDAEQCLADAKGDKGEAATALAEIISDSTDSLLEPPSKGFLADVCMQALQAVNFQEIAEMYLSDCEYKIEETEEGEI